MPLVTGVEEDRRESLSNGEREKIQLAIQLLAETGINGLIEDLVEALEKTKKENKNLKEKVYLDPLTGAYNKKFLEDFRFTSSQVVGVVDVKGLKTINDQKGHHHGDRFLKTVVGKIQDIVRNGDVIRFGGDEFMIVVPKGTDLRAMLSRVNRELRKHRFVLKNKKQISPQIRFGVVTGKKSLKSILTEADEQMYQMIPPTHRSPSVSAM